MYEVYICIFEFLRECKKLMDACKDGDVATVVEQLGKAEVPAYHENADK